jgi:hypothetical protein
MHKTRQPRAKPDIPFAASGVNMTVLLMQILGLERFGKLPTTPAACGFVELLRLLGAEGALHDIYGCSMDILDAYLISQRANIMEFPRHLKEVRRAIEESLAVYPASLADFEAELRKRLGLDFWSDEEA